MRELQKHVDDINELQALYGSIQSTRIKKTFYHSGSYDHYTKLEIINVYKNLPIHIRINMLCKYLKTITKSKKVNTTTKKNLLTLHIKKEITPRTIMEITSSVIEEIKDRLGEEFRMIDISTKLKDMIVTVKLTFEKKD